VRAPIPSPWRDGAIVDNNGDDELSLASFRDEVRTWLSENHPGEPPPLGSPEVRDWSSAWQRRQFDAGWAGIDWPTEYGGRGLSFLKQIVWFEEYVQAGLPIGRSCFVVALAHAGPTLIARGSDEQKAEYLPPILRGDTPWCQGFSEPGSGSDLASLQTKAVIDGDELVVNGQKVWTSYAHLADYQELLVRTDPDAPKHKGITWVICDMRSPGIEVRPIRTIDGGAHFSEVFYQDVRIPLVNVVDELNAGWSVAMSTLSIERGPAALDYQLGTLRDIDELVEVARSKGLLKNEELASRLAMARAEGAALRSMTYLSLAETKPGSPPSPMTTAVRTFWGELQHKTGRLAIDVLGPESLETGPWTEYWLHQFSAGIAGGTKDIQKSIIGERALGLPR
jgi:alkylation response protein AidB-like acyl-CoA dehydrogenase